MKENFFEKTIKYCYILFGFLIFFGSIGGIFISTYYNNSKFYMFFLYATLFVMILFYLRKIEFSKKNLVAVVAFGIIIRISAVAFLNVQPISDYGIYNDLALKLLDSKVLNSDYASLYPHVLGYSFVISKIYAIFGNFSIVMEIVNIFFEIVTMFLLYVISKKIFSQKVAFNAVTIYCFFPSYVLYSEILATEMLSCILYLSLIYFVIKEYRKINIVTVIVFSILLGVFNFIRPTSLIMVIALILYFVFLTKERLLKKVSAILVLLIVYSVVQIPILNFFENLNGKNLAKSPYGYTVYVGANTKSMGRWNEEDFDKTFSLLKKENNANGVHNVLLKEGILRYKNNGILKNIQLLFQKFMVMWSTNDLVCYYLSNDKNFINLNNIVDFRSLCNGFYICITFLIFKSSLKKRNNSIDIFIILILLGFVCQHLIGETMERYSYGCIISLIPIVANCLQERKDKCLKNWKMI